MLVGIICEFSGTIRDAFTARGHTAISCDLLPSATPGPHIQDDCRNHDWSVYDLLICHPPCTYLCTMGRWWNHQRPERIPLMEEAADFFMWCYNLPCERIAVENPVGLMNTRFRKPDQIINPWQFGHEAHKPTCLWLKGLPLLTPTNIVDRGKFYTKKNGKRISAWSHATSGTDKEKRAKIAATTFKGIAEAMADQWGSLK